MESFSVTCSVTTQFKKFGKNLFSARQPLTIFASTSDDLNDLFYESRRNERQYERRKAASPPSPDDIFKRQSLVVNKEFKIVWEEEGAAAAR
jgi:hypothetical protein